MPPVFSASTEITVLFTGWTTSTLTQYILTLIFLFFLPIFSRFLDALKFQLEQSRPQQETVPPSLRLAPVQRRIIKPKHSPLPDYIRIRAEEPEHSLPVSNEDNERITSTGLLGKSESRNCVARKCLFSSWEASGTWSLREDGTRGLLEGVRAFIGYFLWVIVFIAGDFVRNHMSFPG
ncbi:hypothetical protein N7475_003977 [Penicillium sp. IBT 31633x]|nr:hypothetical protein N7475_003977 [Penicillium sp. IBT 31633x]